MWIYVSEKSQVTFERPDDLSNTFYIINHTIKCVKRIMRKKVAFINVYLLLLIEFKNSKRTVIQL